MPGQSMTLDVPSGLYDTLQKRAALAKRSVEDETVNLLAATISSVHDVNHQDLQASLRLLDDHAVERAACSGLPAELSTELEALHLKKQREGLTGTEAVRTAELVRAFERAMLLRAAAAALLQQRGIKVSQPNS